MILKHVSTFNMYGFVLLRCVFASGSREGVLLGLGPMTDAELSEKV